MIDVGLSGVIGADRLAKLQSPYGHFPVEDNRPPCGPADAFGDIRDHVQTDGRCEAADAQGDTYGPVAYEAYLPGYFVFGWSGQWDSLPTAHATSVLWDLIAIIGLWFVGLRFGGPRLGATLAFAWAAWPFTQYASSSNTNDLIEPALLVWGFYFVTARFKRGLFVSLAAWTKFGVLLVPLWSGYPDAPRYVHGFDSSAASPPRPCSRSSSFSSSRRRHATSSSSSITRSRTSSAAPRRSRSGTGGSTTQKGSPISAGFSGSFTSC